MSLLAATPAEQPGERLQRLPDGRYRLTIIEDLSLGLRVNDSALIANGTVIDRALTDKYTLAAELRLFDLDFPVINGSPHRRRIYETLSATAETLIGRPRVGRGDDTRTFIEQDSLQFSAARATPQKVGVATCPTWPLALTGITGTASTDVLTLTGHGLLAGDLVRFTALTGGTGLATATDYYVRDVTTDTFKLAATSAGAAINFTTDITAATLLPQVVAVLTSEAAPDDGTLRRITRRYVEAPAAARFYGDAALIYPFATDGDTTTAEIRQPFYVRADSYTPPTLDALFVAGDAKFVTAPSGNFYAVGDTEPQPIEGACVAFVRTWSKIPATRTVPVGTYPFPYPAIIPGAAGSPKTITALSPNTGNTPLVTPTCTSTAHGLAVGDLITLEIIYSSTPAGQKRGGTVRVTAVPTADTFTTTSFLLFWGGTFNDGTFVSGTATLIRLGRDTPKTIPGQASATYSYALPGVTSGVTSNLDFAADLEFRPYAAGTFEEVNSLNTGTVPTAADYHVQISSRSSLVAKSGVRRYKGKILERETINVIAL